MTGDFLEGLAHMIKQKRAGSDKRKARLISLEHSSCDISKKSEATIVNSNPGQKRLKFKGKILRDMSYHKFLDYFYYFKLKFWKENKLFIIAKIKPRKILVQQKNLVRKGYSCQKLLFKLFIIATLRLFLDTSFPSNSYNL